MLPDFYKAKKKLREVLITYIQLAKKQHLGPFSDVPEIRFFEGHQRYMETEDGIKDMGPFHEAKAETKIDLKDFHNLSSIEFMAKIDKIAEDIAREQSKIGYDEIEKAAKKVGNVVDVKKKPLTVELYLEILERLFISFDSNGKLLLPQIVTGRREDTNKFIEIIKEVHTNFKYKQRYKEIIQRKKLEYDERKASRKLVG